jgi:hypothetical protein
MLNPPPSKHIQWLHHHFLTDSLKENELHALESSSSSELTSNVRRSVAYYVLGIEMMSPQGNQPYWSLVRWDAWHSISLRTFSSALVSRQDHNLLSPLRL